MAVAGNGAIGDSIPILIEVASPVTFQFLDILIPEHFPALISRRLRTASPSFESDPPTYRLELKDPRSKIPQAPFPCCDQVFRPPGLLVPAFMRANPS